MQTMQWLWRLNMNPISGRNHFFNTNDPWGSGPCISVQQRHAHKQQNNTSAQNHLEINTESFSHILGVIYTRDLVHTTLLSLIEWIFDDVAVTRWVWADARGWVGGCGEREREMVLGSYQKWNRKEVCTKMFVSLVNWFKVVQIDNNDNKKRVKIIITQIITYIKSK